MAYIRVAYRTKDRDFDYVPGNRLDTFVQLRMKSAIFSARLRKRWVSVKFDAHPAGRGTGVRIRARNAGRNDRDDPGRRARNAESPVFKRRGGSVQRLARESLAAP